MPSATPDADGQPPGTMLAVGCYSESRAECVRGRES